jgi:hypothetical protein
MNLRQFPDISELSPMELFSADLSTAERIALGVLSLIALIGWCRWRGTPQGSRKAETSQGAEEKRRSSRKLA